MATPTTPARRGGELISWWKRFQIKNKKDEAKPQPATGIFGVPLSESIKYANVAISLTDENGKSFIYGYVPIVVAKCGVFLKEKGMLNFNRSSALFGSLLPYCITLSVSVITV